jgi:hypothetical protein
VKPTGINQLYQAAFTPLPIANHKRHFVVPVLDCFSPIRTTPELIKGLDQALQEARLLSDLPTDRAITLVIDGTGLDTQVLSDYFVGTPFRLGAAEPRTFHSLGSIRASMRS